MAFNRYADYLAGATKRGIKVPGFDFVKPDWSNAFSGMQTKKGVGIALTAGILGGLYAKEKHNVYKQRPAVTNTEEVGQLGRLSYDWVGPERDLGATGDLVLGMHQGRRG